MYCLVTSLTLYTSSFVRVIKESLDQPLYSLHYLSRLRQDLNNFVILLSNMISNHTLSVHPIICLLNTRPSVLLTVYRTRVILFTPTALPSLTSDCWT